ncbi:hypothetical protein EC988_000756 [Linderina pennispora]|nr:hypothetical protein EC988_000756 [Linderina pennispora]
MHDISPGTFSTLSLDQPRLGILDISGTQIGIIDLLYLTNQLPALFRVKFSYAIERNPDWTISQFTSAQIASVRSKLPVVTMCSLREISLSAIRGNSHDYPTVLNAFYLIFLATTRLPSLATISSRDHYIATFSTLQQDISAFTRRSVFDDCPYIRDIEYREI